MQKYDQPNELILATIASDHRSVFFVGDDELLRQRHLLKLYQINTPLRLQG